MGKAKKQSANLFYRSVRVVRRDSILGGLLLLAICLVGSMCVIALRHGAELGRVIFAGVGYSLAITLIFIAAAAFLIWRSERLNQVRRQERVSVLQRRSQRYVELGAALRAGDPQICGGYLTYFEADVSLEPEIKQWFMKMPVAITKPDGVLGNVTSATSLFAEELGLEAKRSEATMRRIVEDGRAKIADGLRRRDPAAYARLIAEVDKMAAQAMDEAEATALRLRAFHHLDPTPA